MDYLRIYQQLIDKGQQRLLDPSIYTEKHHILPRCIGGSDDPTNIVCLLPEEHYLAHLLLARIHENIPSLWYACAVMCSSKECRMRNKSYAFVRKRVSKFMQIDTLNRWAVKRGFQNYFDQSSKIWELYVLQLVTSNQIADMFGCSLNCVRSSLKFYAKCHDCLHELAEATSQHKRIKSKEIRSNFTEEQESRRIAAVKSMDYSARTKKTGDRSGERNPAFGKTWTLPVYVCPHCGKHVRAKRWHFNNCRSKNED